MTAAYRGHRTSAAWTRFALRQQRRRDVLGSAPPASLNAVGRPILASSSTGIARSCIGAFAALAPPIVRVVDLGTALQRFMVLGRQWLLLPGLALEAIPGLGVLPFWLLVVGAIPPVAYSRPTFLRWRSSVMRCLLMVLVALASASVHARES